MSWINDVRHEIDNLDFSKSNLRKFGIYVGIVFCFLALWIILRKNVSFFSVFIGVSGMLLCILGITIPNVLRKVYKIWMGLAFAIGWVISRIILLIIFFLVITPIGIVLRMFGKRFMETEFEKSDKKSYWIQRNRSRNINYQKMY